jgi:hypothetical protein
VCHLLISLATSGKATILRRRGNGNFKGREPYHGASRHIGNLNLSRESLKEPYESDGTFITDREDAIVPVWEKIAAKVLVDSVSTV